MKLSNEKFATLLDNISEAIVATDITYQIVYFNRAAEQVFGYRVEEILGRPLDLLLPVRFAETHRQHLRKLSKSYTVVMIKDRPELVARRKDGSEFPVEVGISRIAQDGEEFYTMIVVDITDRKHAQAALQESEEKFHALIEHSSEAIVQVDAQGTVSYRSPAAGKILGYADQEVIGQSIFNWIHPDDLEHARQAFTRLASEPGSTRTARYPLQGKNGGWRWIEAVGTNLLKDPAVQSIVINYRDITEYKQAEEVLRESEEKFRLIAERITEVFYLVDIRINKTLYVSPGFEQVWGMSRSEVEKSPQNFMKAVHPDDVERVKEGLGVMQGGLPFDLEYRIIRPDGVMRWIWDRGYPVRSANGTVGRYVGVAQDITVRKTAEEALRESEEKFRELIEHGSEAILLIDAQGTIFFESPAAERLLGYSQQELLGHSGLNDVHPGDLEHVREILARLVSEPGSTQRLEYRLRHKDGTWRWVDTVATNSLHVPAVHGIVINGRDTTERKQAESKIQEQLERLTALREVDQAITSIFDVQVSLNLLLSRVISVLTVDAAAVWLLDPFRNVLEYKAGIGFRTNAIQNASVKLGTSLAGRVALERRMVEFQSGSNQPEDQQLADYLRGENFAGYHGAPLVGKGKVIGVLEVFSRSFAERDRDWLDFFGTLAGQAAILIDNTELFNDLQASNRELSLAYDATIEGWSRALDLRDKETEGHTQRVTELTMQLARQFGFPKDELVHIRRGALLHDIGKLGVPDHILWKAEALTESEFEIMKKHPVHAYELLSPIRYLKSAAIDIPYCHHEKWDGAGYPRGLKGEQIPLAARVFAVVDVWDALTSDRPYRRAWSKEKTQAYLSEQAGKSFDPKVVEVFLELLAAERTRPAALQ